MNVIFSPSTIPSFNIAAEEFLFKKLGADFLFLYVNDPSIIIGSNQVVMNEVDYYNTATVRWWSCISR